MAEMEDALLPREHQTLFGPFKTFVECKRSNFVSVLQAVPRTAAAFMRLHEMWSRELGDLQYPRAKGRLLPLLLFVNAHKQFCVATELAFSLCAGSAWNVFRTGIEFAAHAHRVHLNPSLARIWLDKDRDRQARKQFKRAFEERKKDKLFKGLDALYRHYSEFSEWGGHSTIASIARGFSSHSSETGIVIHQGYFDFQDASATGALYRLLDAAHLVEQLLYDCFEGRLKLDAPLVQQRIEFERQKAEAKAECQMPLRFNIVSQAIAK